MLRPRLPVAHDRFYPPRLRLPSASLAGDPPKGEDKFTAVEGGLSCALDLVKYIRAEYGDWFGIGVAGYPEAHPDQIVDDAAQVRSFSSSFCVALASCF